MGLTMAEAMEWCKRTLRSIIFKWDESHQAKFGRFMATHIVSDGQGFVVEGTKILARFNRGAYTPFTEEVRIGLENSLWNIAYSVQPEKEELMDAERLVVGLTPSEIKTQDPKPTFDLRNHRGPINIRSLGGANSYRFESAEEFDSFMKRINARTDPHPEALRRLEIQATKIKELEEIHRKSEQHFAEERNKLQEKLTATEKALVEALLRKKK
jgi:hypothetical protein